jgi:ACS family tartrate transporter-like MFS transporter
VSQFSLSGDRNLGAKVGQSAQIFWRIVPLLFLIFLLSHIDRANLGYAALQMNSALQLSPSIYGIGAGVFSLGLVVCMVPVTMTVTRIGIRFSIALMMIFWSIIAMAMALVWDAPSFIAARFLLGAAEAGFYPTMLIYLTRWFPQAARGKAIGVVQSATTLFGVVGGPISGLILEMPPWLGLAPWQWLFIIEGLPTLCLAFVVLLYLPESPRDATWLTEQDRSVLIAMASAHSHEGGEGSSNVWNAFRNWRIWILAVIYGLCGAAFLAIVLWLPQIVQHLRNLRPSEIGLLTALPYLLGTVMTIWAGWYADRIRNRPLMIIICAVLAAIGCSLSGLLATAPLLSFVALTLGIMALVMIPPPFLAFLTVILKTEKLASVGLPMVVVSGAIGGFISNVLVGVLRQHFGDFAIGLHLIAAFMLPAALLMAGIAYAKPLRRKLGPRVLNDL